MEFKSNIKRFLGARNEVGIFSGERELNLHGTCFNTEGESLRGLDVFVHQLGIMIGSELSTIGQ